MNEKDLYKQKLQAQLNEWQADVDKMKAKLGGASVGAKLELNQQISTMEDKLEEGKSKLDEISKASEESWETIKAGVDEAWALITDTFKEAYEKVLD